MEPKDLLGPTATLFAGLFAIASFLFVRASALYRERQRALSEIDVPDSIRKNKAFNISIRGDFIFLFITCLALFLIAVVYCPNLLYRIANFYLGSPQFSSIDIIANFKEMSQVLLVVSFLLLLVPFILIGGDFFVSRRFPVIVRFFAGNVLGYRLIKKNEAEKFLPEAKKLYEKEVFGESVLYSVASLEEALKNRLGLPPDVGFGRLLGGVREKLGDVISTEELINIRRVRNIAAHPSSERQVTKKDAEQVLRLIEDILQRLQMDPKEG